MGLCVAKTNGTNYMISMSFIEVIVLIMSVISIALGIMAIWLSWVFYQNSQKLDRLTSENLSKISEKISKIDDIVTKQFDKMFSKAIGVDYEGAIPLAEIKFAKDGKKTKAKAKTKK